MKLVIAEKPSVAQSIAKVLGATKKNNGYVEGNDYICSWCVGHLVTLADPDEYGEQYKKWSLDTLPIIPTKFKAKVVPSTKKQFEIVKNLMNSDKVDTIVCATDAGREGELIFRLVYYMAKCNKPIERLWISSLEDSAIRKGFESLKSGSEYDNLYKSAYCRQQADWLVGMNGTRLFTCLYGNGEVLPIGRVQTPTLKMVVDREAEILNFKPEPFYNSIIELNNNVTAKSDKKTQAEASELANVCRSGIAVISNVEKKQNKLSPPKLFDLTSLQREANVILGFTAQQTLSYTQELYERKLVTYPRTDSQFLTEDMKDTARDVILGIAKFLIKTDVNKNITKIQPLLNSAKVTDHHAIIPTLEICRVDLSSLPTTHKNLLLLIAVRLLIATAESYEYMTTTITLDAGGEIFTASGNTINNYGFKALQKLYCEMIGLQKKDEATTQILPAMAINEKYNIIGTNVEEHFTKSKPHFTEATILTAMEKAGAKNMVDDVERKGLGTPATRASIIEKLIADKLITRDKKNLIATDKAQKLMKIIPDIVTSPELTANWENNLVKVSSGEYSADLFMQEIKNTIDGWIAENKTPREEYKHFFGKTTENKEVIGICPVCGGKIYENKVAYSCENRDFSLFKDNKFFATFKKKLNKTMVKTLLTTGRLYCNDLFSNKTKKTFSATFVMSATKDSPYPQFNLVFEKGR